MNSNQPAQRNKYRFVLVAITVCVSLLMLLGATSMLWSSSDTRKPFDNERFLRESHAHINNPNASCPESWIAYNRMKDGQANEYSYPVFPPWYYTPRGYS